MNPTDLAIQIPTKNINTSSNSTKANCNANASFSDIKENWHPERYGVIEEHFPREIIMLRGSGCFHSKCTFCDYHLDKSSDEAANFSLNKGVLDQVNGRYGELEVICSGSVQELDEKTIQYLKKVCIEKQITELSLECHYTYRRTLNAWRDLFSPIHVEFRVGVESFNSHWREVYMNKKMGYPTPEVIAEHFAYCNLLVGESIQTKAQILNDLEIATKLFKRVCIGVIAENDVGAKRNEPLIEWFIDEVVPTIKDNPMFHILITDDDFPLGDGCMTA